MSINYSVGYKRPPQNARFKPGQSGNKKGRPRKKKYSAASSVSNRLLGILRSKVKAPNPDGTFSEITFLEAYGQKCLNTAIQKGDVRTLRALMDMAYEQEAQSGQAPPLEIRIIGGLCDEDDRKR